MEEKLLHSLEATKQEYINEHSNDTFNNLRDQLNRATRRMDNFVGNTKHRFTDHEVRMNHEARVNAGFRSGLQHHLNTPQQDISQQEGFEIISIVENTPFVFATPYRKPIKEEEVPLYPNGLPLEEKTPKSCMVLPRFLSRRRDKGPSFR